MELTMENKPDHYVNANNLINGNSGPKQYGVLVKNACKSYGDGPPVLSEFNMHVEKGTIYGLLGSSGCGKTTILSCIVGLRDLNSGEIVVCGEKPRPGPHLGYMPQEIALYMNMTIKEIMQYFGRIYGMRQQDILKRMEYLMSFLDLPDSSRIIGTLSGGQQRRTSLAVALVHQPELLILDEPTVGVDPIVREKIWEHILSLVERNKTTVIVTTHYIEEARSAHCVGLMRNGRLLCEKAPDALLEEHNAVLLEDIVKHLCKQDEMSIQPAITRDASFTSTITADDTSPIIGIKFKRRHSLQDSINRGTKQRKPSVAEYVHEVTEEYIYSRGDRIRALIIRNFIQLLRNYVFVFAVICIPAVQITFSNLIIGRDARNLPFGMVNREIPGAVGLKNGSICPYQEKGCFTGGSAGCKFVSLLPQESFIMERFDSEKDALAAVQSGLIWGYLSIPENYTTHLQDRALARNFADNETIDGSTISIRIDMSDKIASVLMTKQLFENYQRFLLKTSNDCRQDHGLVELPIKYNKPIYGSLDTGYQDFVGPASLLLILYFVPLGSGGLAYISDRKQGSLDRSMVAGVTTFDVITSFMVSEGGKILFQVLLAFSIMTFGFDFEVKGSVILFIIMCLLTGISGLSLGFLIAMLVNEEVEAVMITVGFFTPIMILSGMIWPLEGVDIFSWYLSHALPSTYPTEAIRSIISRGWGLTHSQVWPGFVVHLVWTLGSWILTAVAYKMRK